MKNFLSIALVALMFSTACAATNHNNEPFKTEAMAFEIIPATGTPVTLEMAKKQVNLDADFNDDNDLLQMYIDGAVGAAEAFIERSLYETRIYSRESFAAFDFCALADASVIGVEYATINEESETVYETLPGENYTFIKMTNSTAYLRYKGDLPLLPSGISPAVKVTVQTQCPPLVKNAILWHVGFSYAKRDGTFTDNEMKPFYNALRPYRKY